MAPNLRESEHHQTQREEDSTHWEHRTTQALHTATVMPSNRLVNPKHTATPPASQSLDLRSLAARNKRGSLHAKSRHCSAPRQASAAQGGQSGSDPDSPAFHSVALCSAPGRLRVSAYPHCAADEPETGGTAPGGASRQQEFSKSFACRCVEKGCGSVQMHARLGCGGFSPKTRARVAA